MRHKIEPEGMFGGYLFWYEERNTIFKIMGPIVGLMTIFMGILWIGDLIVNFSSASTIGIIVWIIMICCIFAMSAFLVFCAIRSPWSEEVTIDGRSIKEWRNGKMVREVLWSDISRIEFGSITGKRDIGLLLVSFVSKVPSNIEKFHLTNAKVEDHREFARILMEEAWKRNIPYRD
ncbi:MAG: hypothetical protein ACMUHM_08965 [Thermoplasmatota archaeon]